MNNIIKKFYIDCFFFFIIIKDSYLLMYHYRIQYKLVRFGYGWTLVLERNR